jgi:hypothetical protein
VGSHFNDMLTGDGEENKIMMGTGGPPVRTPFLVSTATIKS